MLSKSTILLVLLSLIYCSSAAQAGELFTVPKEDPHYTKVGFFDLHACNWPDRDLFFMSLFSTYDYEQLQSVEVLMPDGKKLGNIQTKKYRLLKKKGKPDKRVFLSQIDVPKDAQNGWYKAIVTMKNGDRHESRDYVVIERMKLPTGLKPGDDMTVDKVPEKLIWNKVAGATHYLVFIRDLWANKSIYKSKPLTKAELILPKGLLKDQGYYGWKVHARDVNGNVLLGDFNHGTLSKLTEFSIGD